MRISLLRERPRGNDWCGNMASIGTERVLSVHHWNESVFSFRTTRDPSFRFENGHFVMLGMPVGEKPLMRAYSIASANHEEALEFLSIKVPDGPLTSKLQHIKPGDEICISRKPTGTLLLRDLKAGKRLYLLEFRHGTRALHEPDQGSRTSTSDSSRWCWCMACATEANWPTATTSNGS